MRPASAYRLALCLSLIFITPAGYIARFSPSLPAVVADVLGSLAYEIFWVLLVVGLWPRVSLKGAAVGVCCATCGIEFLQLWHPPFLEALRQTLPGRLVLGNSFRWADFPPYFIGSGLGWAWAWGLREWIRRSYPRAQ
jgi:hypothetical protein